MKMRALSMVRCVCLAIGAMAGCSSEHPDFPGSHAESHDGGTAAQAGESGGEEHVREKEFYLKKAVTYDLRGNTTEYEYDRQGSLIKMTVSTDRSYENSINTHRKESEYDNFGNVLREVEEGVMSYKVDAGDLRAVPGYEEDYYSRYTSEASYEYDAAGNLIRKTEFEYDARSNVIKNIYYYGDREMHRTEYKYDEVGNKTGETYYENGDIRFQTEYSTEEEYNDAGLLIKSVSCENGKAVSWTEYEYEQGIKFRCLYVDI